MKSSASLSRSSVDARTHGAAQHLHGAGENPPALRHQIDLARRLEPNHLRTYPRSALNARLVMSSTAPTAFTTASVSPLLRYQSSTALRRRRREAARIASGRRLSGA
jgi:hypothetical protein